MEMVNGYVFIDLLGTNVYKKSLGAIKSGKPVLVKDYEQVYYADTIKTATIDDDVVVQITKGGKTITINDANAVSSVGEIQEKISKYIIQLTLIDDTNVEDDIQGYVTIISNKELNYEPNTPLTKNILDDIFSGGLTFVDDNDQIVVGVKEWDENLITLIFGGSTHDYNYTSSKIDTISKLF